MVRHAFRVLTDDEIKTRLIAFSDDMDGLRKAPDNIPNRELIARHLGKPLTEVPDPFGEYESFAAHNNARLREFLDDFGFDYEFASSTDYYKSGRFDAALLHMLARFDAVQEIMLPSLREERAATYSPFLPIHPRTRVVMQVPLDRRRSPTRGRSAGAIPTPARNSRRPSPAAIASCNGSPTGRCAGMRCRSITKWPARTSSIRSSSRSQIVRALGGRAARRASTTNCSSTRRARRSRSRRATGSRIEEWLTYASPESLSLFMFQKPIGGEAALFRRDPAHGRRLSQLSRRLSAPGMEGAARQSGLACPCRRAARAGVPRARRRSADDRLVRDAAQSRRRRQQRQSGGARGASCAATRRTRRRETHPRLDKLVHYAVALFPRFRARRRSAIAPPTRSSARRCEAVSAKLATCRPARAPRKSSTALYDVARPIPRYQDLKAKGATPERPGRLQRVLQHDLRRAARRGARAAARLVHRALRDRARRGR